MRSHSNSDALTPPGGGGCDRSSALGPPERSPSTTRASSTAGLNSIRYGSPLISDPLVVYNLTRRVLKVADGVHRHMVKYSYWRKAAPVPDWVQEADFDPHTAYYGGHNVA